VGGGRVVAGVVVLTGGGTAFGVVVGGTVVGVLVVAVATGGASFVLLVAAVFSGRLAFAATGREDPQAANVSSGKRTPATANAWWERRRPRPRPGALWSISAGRSGMVGSVTRGWSPR
jgi:hypothetical protein